MPPRLQPGDGAAFEKPANRCRWEPECPAYTDCTERFLMPVDPLQAYAQPLSHLFDIEKRSGRRRDTRAGFMAKQGEEMLPGHGNSRPSRLALSDKPERGPVLGGHSTACGGLPVVMVVLLNPTCGTACGLRDASAA